LRKTNPIMTLPTMRGASCAKRLRPLAIRRRLLLLMITAPFNYYALLLLLRSSVTFPPRRHRIGVPIENARTVARRSRTARTARRAPCCNRTAVSTWVYGRALALLAHRLRNNVFYC
jgi:hypothetical protein